MIPNNSDTLNHYYSEIKKDEVVCGFTIEIKEIQKKDNSLYCIIYDILKKIDINFYSVINGIREISREIKEYDFDIYHPNEPIKESIEQTIKSIFEKIMSIHYEVDNKSILINRIKTILSLTYNNEENNFILNFEVIKNSILGSWPDIKSDCIIMLIDIKKHKSNEYVLEDWFVKKLFELEEKSEFGDAIDAFVLLKRNDSYVIDEESIRDQFLKYFQSELFQDGPESLKKLNCFVNSYRNGEYIISDDFLIENIEYLLEYPKKIKFLIRDDIYIVEHIASRAFISLLSKDTKSGLEKLVKLRDNYYSYEYIIDSTLIKEIFLQVILLADYENLLECFFSVQRSGEYVVNNDIIIDIVTSLLKNKDIVNLGILVNLNREGNYLIKECMTDLLVAFLKNNNDNFIQTLKIGGEYFIENEMVRQCLESMIYDNNKDEELIRKIFELKIGEEYIITDKLAIDSFYKLSSMNKYWICNILINIKRSKEIDIEKYLIKDEEISELVEFISGKGHSEMIELFLKEKRNGKYIINNDTIEIALRAAVINGRTDTVKVIMESYDRFYFEPDLIKKLAYLAIENGYEKIVEELKLDINDLSPISKKIKIHDRGSIYKTKKDSLFCHKIIRSHSHNDLRSNGPLKETLPTTISLPSLSVSEKIVHPASAMTLSSSTATTPVLISANSPPYHDIEDDELPHAEDSPNSKRKHTRRSTESNAPDNKRFDSKNSPEKVKQTMASDNGTSNPIRVTADTATPSMTLTPGERLQRITDRL